jgi:hypothetical protein
MILKPSRAPARARFLLYATPGSTSAAPGAINGSPYPGEGQVCYGSKFGALIYVKNNRKKPYVIKTLAPGNCQTPIIFLRES